MDNSNDIEVLVKLINIGNEFEATFPYVSHNDFKSWVSKVKSSLPRGYLGRISRLELFREDINEFDGEVVSVVNESAIKYLLIYLKDQLYKKQNQDHNTKSYSVGRIIEAREKDIHFERELAERVCGDNPTYPYKTGAGLTDFFHDLGHSFTHDGSTRRFWVERRLLVLSAEEILDLIQHGLFNKKYYSSSEEKDNSTKLPPIKPALAEFQEFMRSETIPNTSLGLDLIFGTSSLSDLFFSDLPKTSDDDLNTLLDDSKEYFRRGERKIALEKIWDGYERLKTLLDDNKSVGVNKLQSVISKEIEISTIEKEMRELTEIGNRYHIRHFEVNKLPLTNNVEITYLFFRMLAFINYALVSIQQSN